MSAFLACGITITYLSRSCHTWLLELHIERLESNEIFEKSQYNRCADLWRNLCFLSKAKAKRWFSRFRSGSFDVEDPPDTDRSITEKVEQDQHTSMSFKPFGESWLQKEARCLGVTWHNIKIHVQISTETYLNQSSHFWSDWSRGHKKLITNNNNVRKSKKKNLIDAKKVMIYLVLLPRSKRINSDYCKIAINNFFLNQLELVNLSHYDNIRSHELIWLTHKSQEMR